MAQRISQKKILRELNRISKGIPEELLKNLLKWETIAPTLKDLIERAIKLGDDEITPEKRQRFQNLIDAGVLDREVQVIDKEGEGAISAYYDAEIALAVKLGRLPKDAPMPAFIRKKGIKYAKKQRARLEGVFSADEDTDTGEGGDTPEDSGADSARGDDAAILQAPGEWDGK